MVGIKEVLHPYQNIIMFWALSENYLHLFQN